MSRTRRFHNTDPVLRYTAFGPPGSGAAEEEGGLVPVPVVVGSGKSEGAFPARINVHAEQASECNHVPPTTNAHADSRALPALLQPSPTSSCTFCSRTLTAGWSLLPTSAPWPLPRQLPWQLQPLAAARATAFRELGAGPTMQAQGRCDVSARSLHCCVRCANELPLLRKCVERNVLHTQPVCAKR